MRTSIKRGVIGLAMAGLVATGVATELTTAGPASAAPGHYGASACNKNTVNKTYKMKYSDVQLLWGPGTQYDSRAGVGKGKKFRRYCSLYKTPGQYGWHYGKVLTGANAGKKGWIYGANMRAA
ncbi:hypothetical protein ACTWJ8_40465 (plasmid) [Streptomyces sp. SDT5-1]|uniref:hypothetical protein n=1 Tax=Streptomyces sp. SDT5-1 TaxID=3406418 RepID=UPI003FD12280